MTLGSFVFLPRVITADIVVSTVSYPIQHKMAPSVLATPHSSSSSRAQLPAITSIPIEDAAYVTTCRAATPNALKRKVSKEVRFALGSETPVASRSTERRGPDMTTMCAPRHGRTKVGYVSQAMRDSLMQTSNLCTSALVKQAHELVQPDTRRLQTRYSLIDRRNGFVVYETIRHHAIAEEDEGEACVDDDVVLLQDSVGSLVDTPHDWESSQGSGSDGAPRMSGTIQVQAPLEEYIATFAERHDHDLAQQHLNPGMASTDRVYTLMDEKNKRICVKWMVFEPKAAGTMARRRDFVVVECQKRFQLHDGRRGWVQSLQSIDFPWYPAHDQESGFVRGTFHQSGVVAIESLDNSNAVEVVVIAEVALKGNSSGGAQRAVSRRRVIKTMQAFGEVIETDRVERMSYLGTLRFIKLELDQKDKKCKICSDRFGIIGLKARHSCRKCGGSVCGSCSQVWQVERTRSTVIVGGGRVTTRTRVCTECLLHARKRDLSASVRDSSGLTNEYTTDTETTRNLLATTLPPPRMTENGISRDRNKSVFTSAMAMESMMPMRPTQLEFALISNRHMSPSGSLLGDSDGTTDDEDDQTASSPEQSPRDRMEVVRGSECDRPAVLRLSELAHDVDGLM